jgi:multidrug resistance efflux pump
MSESDKKDSEVTTSKEDATGTNAKVEKKGRDPVTIGTGVVLFICVLMLICHIFMDKYTPYTADGRIEAFIVPITPQVSGTLIAVDTINNQYVEANQVLAKIDSKRYEIAVKRAQADLQQASQTSAADVNAVTTAQAKVAEAEANLRNAEVKGQRVIKLSKVGAASVSRADDARSSIEAKKAQLLSAKSELDKTKSNLGMTGKDNARILSALSALETAELDLSKTIIKAPSNGIITNLLVDVGHFANAGAPMMTFISTRDVWVQANMRDNSLGLIEAGNKVEMVLDSAPGHIFTGEVMSVGYGVSDNNSDALGGLATVQTTQGWLRQAQHFPVLIRFTDESVKGHRRAGGQVNVMIYTGKGPILNSLAFAWIRAVSFFSHIY